MNTFGAMLIGDATRERERMVFDWDTAAKILKEKKPEWAEAGLDGDLGNTSDTIWYLDENNEYRTERSHPYLASTWAMPVLILYYDDKDKENETIACYVMESETEWDEHTVWPQSALDILKED